MATKVQTFKYVSRKPSCLDRAVVKDDVPIEIIPGLFIGSIHCAFNDKSLQEAGITHIVNVSGVPATFPKLFSYLTINIKDKAYSNMLACISASNMFIKEAIEPGKRNVLVHCSFGRSRSASLIVAYLMAEKKYSYAEAYRLVKAQRPVVSINNGFKEQLAAFEIARYNSTLAAQNYFVEKHNKEPSSLQKVTAAISFCGTNRLIPLLLSIDFQ